MATLNLSLNLDDEQLRRVEHLAAARGMTISQMVARLLQVVSQPSRDPARLSPLTRSALGMLPPLGDAEVNGILDEERMRKYEGGI
jgi:hypothetical protein